MDRRAVLGLVGAGAVGVSAGASADSGVTTSFVSLVRLLSRPRELDQTVVMTAGYLAFDQGGADIYLHREDYEACILPNSLRVALTAAQGKQWAGLHRSHVAIKARYAIGEAQSIQCGTLGAVEALDQVPGREVGK